jgi:crotonobetainyl-CoA:carnitine CoA-transferase CaiB-like acyl-CoA transferase
MRSGLPLAAALLGSVLLSVSAAGADPILAADPALATNAGRLGQRERIIKEISSTLAGAPASRWLERLHDAGVPAGVVKTVREVTTEVHASPVSGMPPREYAP